MRWAEHGSEWKNLRQNKRTHQSCRLDRFIKKKSARVDAATWKKPIYFMTSISFIELIDLIFVIFFPLLSCDSHLSSLFARLCRPQLVHAVQILRKNFIHNFSQCEMYGWPNACTTKTHTHKYRYEIFGFAPEMKLKHLQNFISFTLVYKYITIKNIIHENSNTLLFAF